MMDVFTSSNVAAETCGFIRTASKVMFLFVVQSGFDVQKSGRTYAKDLFAFLSPVPSVIS